MSDSVTVWCASIGCWCRYPQCPNGQLAQWRWYRGFNHVWRRRAAKKLWIKLWSESSVTEWLILLEGQGGGDLPAEPCDTLRGCSCLVVLVAHVLPLEEASVYYNQTGDPTFSLDTRSHQVSSSARSETSLKRLRRILEYSCWICIIYAEHIYFQRHQSNKLQGFFSPKKQKVASKRAPNRGTNKWEVISYVL